MLILPSFCCGVLMPGTHSSHLPRGGLSGELARNVSGFPFFPSFLLSPFPLCPGSFRFGAGFPGNALWNLFLCLRLCPMSLRWCSKEFVALRDFKGQAGVLGGQEAYMLFTHEAAWPQATPPPARMNVHHLLALGQSRSSHRAWRGQPYQPGSPKNTIYISPHLQRTSTATPGLNNWEL